MIVDLKRFKPGQHVGPGTLTVVEQLPSTKGGCMSADMSKTLLQVRQDMLTLGFGSMHP